MIDHSKDFSDTTRRPSAWWDSSDEGEPHPYATATWTYFQEVVEIEEADG